MRASNVLVAVATAAAVACGGQLVGGVLRASCAVCSEIAPLCEAENAGATAASVSAAAVQNVHVYVGGNRLQCLSRGMRHSLGGAGGALNQ